MARKNKRLKTEYHRGLGFDPRKYITVPVHHAVRSTPEHTPQRGEIWFADLGSHPNSSVQGGIRPVVIVSNDIGNAHADTVNIVPMTRHLKKPELPCHTKLSPECIMIILVLNFLHHSYAVLESDLVRSAHLSSGSIAQAVQYLMEHIYLLLAQRVFKRYTEIVKLIGELSGVNIHCCHDRFL